MVNIKILESYLKETHKQVPFLSIYELHKRILNWIYPHIKLGSSAFYVNRDGLSNTIHVTKVKCTSPIIKLFKVLCIKLEKNGDLYMKYHKIFKHDQGVNHVNKKTM